MAHSRSSSTDSFKSFDSTSSQTTKQTQPQSELETELSYTRTPSICSSKPSKDTTASDIHESRLPPQEEAACLSESTTLKTKGNSFFAAKDFSTAIQTYDKALGALPDYLDYEIAVLRSNVAACYLKLEEWKQAVESATKAAERLDTLVPIIRPKAKAKEKLKKARTSADTIEGVEKNEGGHIEEVDDAEAEVMEHAEERLKESGHTHDEVQRLRIKVLLRQAKGRTQLGTWTELAGAEENYVALLQMAELSGLDRQMAQRELRILKPKLEVVKARETQEMMGKLKEMGNGLLKPFGLSTDMFNFVKDEKTGGYSMSIGKGNE